MPQRFSNSSLSKKPNIINIPNNTNIPIENENIKSQNENNNILENNIKNEIKNSQNEEELKEEEFNLELLNKKYIENNFEEDEINNEEKNISQNNEENSNENNNQLQNLEIEEDNNNYIEDNKDEEINDEQQINDNNYINIKNIEDDLGVNEYQEKENNCNNIEIEEIEIEDYNEKYNLPLVMNNNKTKIQNENNELINKISNEDNNGEKEKELIDNEEKIINDNILNKEKENNENEVIDTSKKENIENNFTNESNDNIKINIKNKNQIAENYEDYILSTLEKLKKNHLIKPNKEMNKTFNLSKNNINKELIKNQSDNKIRNPISKLVKRDKVNTPPNDFLDLNKKNIHISPIINSCSITRKKKFDTEENEELNPSKENKNIQLSENNLNKNEEIPEGAKFGIDETGNPLNLSQLKDMGKNNNKKLIAFIMQKEDEENNKINYLVDKNGNVLKKSKEGDYLYKNGDTYVVIKDFDVQHPGLRVYGHRSYNSSEIKILSDKVTIDNNVENIKNNIYLNNKKEDKYKQINNKTEENEIANKNFILDLKEKNNYNNFNSTDNVKNLLLSNSNNHSFIKKNINNKYKINRYGPRKREESNKLMTIWRKRYGNRNNNINNLNKKQINYSYTARHEDRLVERTNSILKMASEREKKNISFVTEGNNNELTRISYTKYYPRLTITKKYNIPIYSNEYIKKKYENPLLKKYTSSFSKNINNPLLKNNNILLRNNLNEIPKIKMYTENLLYKEDIGKNKMFDYFNRNINVKNSKIRNNLLKNIIQKNKELKKVKTFEINKNKINSSIIKDYIYNKIKQINKRNNKKKNLNKYSILSLEANNIIKDFNNNQMKKNKMVNKNNILINNSFNNNKNNHYIQLSYNNYLSNNNMINKKDNKIKSTSFENINNNSPNAVLNPDLFNAKYNFGNFSFNRNKLYK